MEYKLAKITTHNTFGHYDFELNIQRSSLLTYHTAKNENKNLDGILFSIPGFGDDNLISYQKNLIE